MENIKKSPGRPKKPENERSVIVGLRLTPARKLIYHKLGGAKWVTAQIDRAINS